jgi:MFS transporter, UMF1 family
VFGTRRASGREVLSWGLYDFANSAFATTILAVIFNRYYAGVVAGGEEGVAVTFFGQVYQVPGATMFTWIVTASMLLVAITAPLLGAWADARAAKKRFLGVYVLIGVFGTAMLGSAGEGDWLSAGLWFILANFAFAGGNVFYNAFLNELADPDEMGAVSGFGWGIGYLGGGLLLIINLLMLEAPHLFGFAEGELTVHHTFITVAIWWGLFSLPFFLNVKERAVATTTSALEGMRASVRRLRTTLGEVREHKQLWRFLIAYLFFNDGIETVILMAAIYGDQELGMAQGMLVIYFLVIQFTAFGGSLLFGRISGKIGVKPALMTTLFVWCGVVTAAFAIGWTGYPITEYFVLGVVAGLVMGASQSLARTMQGLFTPPEREAEFYGFFAISGRFAAVLGPLTFGVIVAITGSLRWAILSVIVFFIAGLLLLSRVQTPAERTPETVT